ncbi:OLC1v1001506C1 [Oldenlandia corymbosa var. corymbosa]|uniref:OLC1v1001506C1 n=1 Tax=Oldenlandia corymbosa var. corymbosa TaxID=529605 RepID=A0AAV1D7Y1_OLDCO|nr:OLC1v1001506C1 [Oldenlandia corymbosa var. corymbosa]
MKATELEESCSALRKELEDAQDDLKVAKDELDVVQVEFGEKGCGVGEGLGNSMFQRQFKRVSYYQKAIGEHKMALHYHPLFEGVKLEEMPGYNPNATTIAQEATVALHHLALDYHRVLADYAQNPTPILMDIRAKRLLPNPEASTSHTVTGQGSSGAGDGEGEVN